MQRCSKVKRTRPAPVPEVPSIKFSLVPSSLPSTCPAWLPVLPWQHSKRCLNDGETNCAFEAPRPRATYFREIKTSNFRDSSCLKKVGDDELGSQRLDSFRRYTGNPQLTRVQNYDGTPKKGTYECFSHLQLLQHPHGHVYQNSDTWQQKNVALAQFCSCHFPIYNLTGSLCGPVILLGILGG